MKDSTKERVRDVLTVPNVVTFFRCVAAVFIWVSCLTGISGVPFVSDYRAGVVLLLAYATTSDFLDGWVARTFDLKSTTGQFLDPIADKVLCWSIMYHYLVLHSDWTRLVPAALLVVYDIGVVYLRFWGSLRVVTKLAKIKTTVLMVAAAFAILEVVGVSGMVAEFTIPEVADVGRTVNAIIALTLVWASGILAVVSGIQYFKQYKLERSAMNA